MVFTVVSCSINCYVKTLSSFYLMIPRQLMWVNEEQCGYTKSYVQCRFIVILGSGILSFNPHLKVDVHESVAYLNQARIFEWYVFRCDSKNGTNRCVFKSDWIVCSEYHNRPRLNNQNNWRNLYNHLMNMQFTLILNKIYI